MDIECTENVVADRYETRGIHCQGEMPEIVVARNTCGTTDDGQGIHLPSKPRDDQRR